MQGRARGVGSTQLRVRRGQSVSPAEDPVSSRTRHQIRKTSSLSPNRHNATRNQAVNQQVNMSRAGGGGAPAPVLQPIPGPPQPVPGPVNPSPIIYFPMPQPGTAGAPCFKGKYISDFLANLETAGRNAGIDVGALPALLPRYCNRKVNRVICFEPEFSGMDWDQASEKLKSIQTQRG